MRLIANNWKLPVRVSVGFHIVAFIFVGLLTQGMMEYHAPKEDLIEIDMSMVQPQRARSETPKLSHKAHSPKEVIREAMKQASPSHTPQTTPVASTAPATEATGSAPVTADGWLSAGGGSGETGEEVGSGYGETGEAGAVGGSDEGEDGGESEGDAIGRFLARVESRKEYPYMAMRRNLTGTVTVQVTIGVDGSLYGAEVISSSGAKMLDEAGLKAVKNSCPFPHDVGRTICMNIPISFYLN